MNSFTFIRTIATALTNAPTSLSWRAHRRTNWAIAVGGNFSLSATPAANPNGRATYVNAVPYSRIPARAIDRVLATTRRSGVISGARSAEAPIHDSKAASQSMKRLNPGAHGRLRFRLTTGTLVPVKRRVFQRNGFRPMVAPWTWS